MVATSSEKKAEKLKNDMEKEGYFSFIENVHKNEKDIYRVRLGVYSSKGNALIKLKELKDRYLKNPYVKSAVIVESSISSNNSAFSAGKLTNIESIKSLGNFIKINRPRSNSSLYKSSKSKYSVQLFATSKKELAESLVIALQNFDYDAYVMEYIKSNKAIFRIRIGDSNDIREVRSLLSELKSKFNSSSIMEEAVITKDGG